MGDVLSQHCTNVICNMCHIFLKFCVTFCMTLIDISDYLLHGECEVGNCIDVRRYVDDDDCLDGHDGHNDDHDGQPTDGHV